MAAVGSQPGVNVVVELGRNSGVRRGLIHKDDTPDEHWGIPVGDGTHVPDMGTSDTLKNFITWSVANYPASNYALVLWDHGLGFVGVCIGNSAAPPADMITPSQLTTVEPDDGWDYTPFLTRLTADPSLSSTGMATRTSSRSATMTCSRGKCSSNTSTPISSTRKAI